MLSAGGALLIGTGAVMNYLKAQQPEQQMSDLTLANLEAMAFIDPDLDLGGDSEGGKIDCYGALVDAGCGHITITKCSTCLDETCTDYSDSAKCKK